MSSKIYRGHTISASGTISGFGALFGGDWRHISGPYCNGGTGGGIRGAKQMIDKNIREHECNVATQHAHTIERNDRKYCIDCGAFLGMVLHPGEGARYRFYRMTANGHKYGYSLTRDHLGKWYAIDQPRVGENRLVKCATRAKAKAKATEWWYKASALRTKA